MSSGNHNPSGADGMLQSAYVERNSPVFRQLLDVHVPDGSTVYDVTYGDGVFWNEVPEGKYDVVGSDISPEKSPSGQSVDLRSLPYDNSVADCIVLDPPYTSGFFRTSNRKGDNGDSYDSFAAAYTSDHTDVTPQLHSEAQKTRKRHARVLDLFYRGIEEAHRVLHDSGILIVKCQDEVSDNKQYLTHVEITNFAEECGFEPIDLVVVVRQNRASTPHDNQHAALKRHSYFLVFDADGGSLRS